MRKPKEVKYVVGTTLDAKPITVTHYFSDDERPEQENGTPTKYRSKGKASASSTKRKTCSHAQKDARMRHQSQQTKKK